MRPGSIGAPEPMRALQESGADAVRASLEKYIGQPMGPALDGPDPVNVPMIRHWVAALDDRNPVYLDEGFAARTRHGGLVAPTTMLQVWGMPSPKLEGIAERGGSPVEIAGDNIIRALESVSTRKTTGLGQGYFVTWVTSDRDAEGELVGRQRFRIFKFDPRTIDPRRLGAGR
jgi:hypothetical protein